MLNGARSGGKSRSRAAWFTFEPRALCLPFEGGPLTFPVSLTIPLVLLLKLMLRFSSEGGPLTFSTLPIDSVRAPANFDFTFFI